MSILIIEYNKKNINNFKKIVSFNNIFNNIFNNNQKNEKIKKYFI